MPMYNPLEFCDNYSKTSGSLSNHYRDEVNYSAIENNKSNGVNNNKTITSKSVEYKIKIKGKTPHDNNTLH